jgi:hypothetical protein
VNLCKGGPKARPPSPRAVLLFPSGLSLLSVPAREQTSTSKKENIMNTCTVNDNIGKSGGYFISAQRTTDEALDLIDRWKVLKI